MQGVLSLARLAIVSFLANPIRVYAVACQYGWREEAVLASTKPLAFDIADPAVSHSFAGIESTHLAALLGLHWRRRQGIESVLRIISTGAFGCAYCGISPHYDVAWKKLELRITREMARNPSASFIKHEMLFEWPESVAMRDWTPNNSCSNDRPKCLLNGMTLESVCSQLNAAADRLPNSI
jgi:hypothetical protein